jgi:hypothetical protein
VRRLLAQHRVGHHLIRPGAVGDGLPCTGQQPCGTPAGASHDDGLDGEDDLSGADLGIQLGDAPVPARGGQPCSPRIAAIRLTIAEVPRAA